MLLPPNSTLSLQFPSICTPLHLLKAKLPVCTTLKWFPMHHHPIKAAYSMAAETPVSNRKIQGALNGFQDVFWPTQYHLLFFCLWLRGGIYYQYCTVSVSYKPYPSLRQNSGWFLAARIAFKANGRKKAELDWQNPKRLKPRGESSLLKPRKKLIYHNKSQGGYILACLMYFSFLSEFSPDKCPLELTGPVVNLRSIEFHCTTWAQSQLNISNSKAVKQQDIYEPIDDT